MSIPSLRSRATPRRARQPLTLLLTLALVVPLTASVGTGAASAGSPAPSVVAASTAADEGRQATAPAARNRAENYKPSTGVKVSNPLRSDAQRRVIAHMVNSIKSTRGTQKIRMFTWNLASPTITRELVDAHKRGVSVRFIMSAGKAAGNGEFKKLKRAFKTPSSRHPQGRKLRSWARKCEGSCRGTRGIAHSKFIVFSQVGKKTKRVVMSTSANMTEVSANSQWNDIFTQVGTKSIYNAYMTAFKQAAKDKKASPPYMVENAKSISAYFYPWKGKNARGDRAKKELKRITCSGAQGGTGINGKTRIRIAQDAIINDRGIELAKILRHKWESGCNIRIVYALLGRQVRTILGRTSRGPVPTRQIVQDFDGDYVYERYLHAKVMTVSGHYGSNNKARIAWQGSENWSGLAKLSDEQGFKIRRSGAEGAYARWVDYLYNNPPPRGSGRQVAARESAARAQGIDPYALIREELVG